MAEPSETLPDRIDWALYESDRLPLSEIAMAFLTVCDLRMRASVERWDISRPHEERYMGMKVVLDPKLKRGEFVLR